MPSALSHDWIFEAHLHSDMFSEHGFTRHIPFGCHEGALLTLLCFLPGQAMSPHRHLASNEYFTAVGGEAQMLVDSERVLLGEGATFLRRRGVLHAIRNHISRPLMIQSFQVPLPTDETTVWEPVPGWDGMGTGCPRCWCGQTEEGRCLNCSFQYIPTLPPESRTPARS